VDYVFITTSANNDLNFGRLERYLTFALDSGASPVILLTKADLVEDRESMILSVHERFSDVAIHALTKEDFESACFFSDYLSAGKTAVLVGSSGVGKSTLSNYLIGADIIDTQEVRESDDKGRHTTTSRSMYKTFYGGLIIDTPGMRELQFSTHEEGFEHLFSDIEELMRNCKFHNCHHQKEVGCAVLEALHSGELLYERWKSYSKIQNEVRHEMRKIDKRLMSEDRKVWKQRSMAARRNSRS
jgi:ribosome biogenesis GTPase